MSPAVIYKTVRDVLVIAAIAFILYRIYTDGKNAVRAEQLNSIQKAVEQQAGILKQWHTEATNANTELAASIGRINSTPTVVHDWVRPPTACQERSMLPAAAGAAGASGANTGGIRSEHGGVFETDRRDSIVAEFKRRWGTELALCQADLDQWPQP